MAGVTGGSSRAGSSRAGSSRASFKDRAVERMARAVAGDRLDQLQQRLDDLEAEVQECRQLNIRLAEVTDLVEQLLLPMAARDEEKIAAAVEKYSRTI
jgi:TolA-binding protein